MVTGQRRGSQSGLKAPVSSPFPYADILRDIQKEWNKAEAAIKQSEQVALAVSIPAITELRYAGRRLVDALDLAHNNGDDEKIRALLEDARFCCHRAQHDAIDAAIAKIGIDLDDLTSKLGFEAVIQSYPEFRDLYADFGCSRAKIVNSRGKRDDRNGIYDAITSVDLPSLVGRYDKLMAVRPIAKSAAWKLKLGGITGWALLVIALVGCVFAGLGVPWEKYFGDDAKPAAVGKGAPAEPK